MGWVCIHFSPFFFFLLYIFFEGKFLLKWFLSFIFEIEADMTKPVHRHLAEQKWRKQGDLDLLVCKMST